MTMTEQLQQKSINNIIRIQLNPAIPDPRVTEIRQ